MDFVGTRQIYSISGIVTDSNSQPLANVQVSASGHTATTGADGAYTLSNLPAATYTVTASLAEHSFSPASQSVTVGPNQSSINFVGTGNAYTISGTVKNGAGNPVSGVTVSLTGPTNLTATTNAAGVYSVTGLAAGAYTVTPSLTETTFAPATQSVTIGPDKTGADFTATTNTYTVSGTVKDAAGQPLAGIQVTAGTQTATTQSDGTYSLTGLTAGDLLVVPAKAKVVFTPNYQSVTVGPNETGVNFTGTADADQDGVSDAIENGAPNNSDGNGDGIPDSQQINVASFPNAVDGSYVTLAAPQGLTLVNTFAYPKPDSSSLPQGMDLPVGVVSFTLQGVTPGGAATVTLYLHTSTPVTSYYKYGPTADNTTPHWYEFLYDGTTGAEINGNVIKLHLKDGQRGDWDLTANGVIVDPGGPALPPSAPVSVGQGDYKWSIISLPDVPGGFDPFAGLLDKSRSSYLVRWNAGKTSDPTYLKYEYMIYGSTRPDLQFSAVENGRGYWRKGSGAFSQTYASRTTSFDLPVYAGSDPYAHWNLIGVPYTSSIDLSTLKVVTGGTTRSFDDAITAGAIDAYVWRYRNPTNGYELLTTPLHSSDFSGVVGTTLDPGLGYWVHVQQDSTLRFNSQATPPPLSPSARGAKGVRSQTLPSSPSLRRQSQNGWAIQLRARG